MIIFLPQKIIFEPGSNHAVIDETLRRRSPAQIRTPLPEHVFGHFDSPATTGASKDIRQRLVARNPADIIEQRLGGIQVDFKRLDVHTETLAKRATFYQPGIASLPSDASNVLSRCLFRGL